MSNTRFVGMCLCLLAGFSARSLAEDKPFTKADFLSKVTVSATRNKASRVEGGDWDDRKDRISFKVKLVNSDANHSFNGIKCELYIFGQSLVEKKAFKLLKKASNSLSLAPLQTGEYETPEVVTMWDDTDAIFGQKYKGWYLLIYGPGGDLLLEKSVASFLENTSTLGTLTEGSYYDRKLQPITVEESMR